MERVHQMLVLEGAFRVKMQQLLVLQRQLRTILVTDWGVFRKLERDCVCRQPGGPVFLLSHFEASEHF